MKIKGKVAYFTTLFPYVVITILVIRGALFEGALKGVQFYVGTFVGEKLGDIAVWRDAVSQLINSVIYIQRYI